MPTCGRLGASATWGSSISQSGDRPGFAQCHILPGVDPLAGANPFAGVDPFAGADPLANTVSWLMPCLFPNAIVSIICIPACRRIWSKTEQSPVPCLAQCRILPGVDPLADADLLADAMSFSQCYLSSHSSSIYSLETWLMNRVTLPCGPKSAHAACQSSKCHCPHLCGYCSSSCCRSWQIDADCPCRCSA